MFDLESHNAWVDSLAAAAPGEARLILARGLQALIDEPLSWAQAWELAGVAVAHLDEMRVDTAEEFARVQAAGDDFFAWKTKRQATP